MASILNKTHTRKFILDVANQKRPGQFRGVSELTLDKLEAVLKNIIVDKVHKHPSKKGGILKLE